jgi:SAM-dependent methyltransferase
MRYGIGLPIGGVFVSEQENVDQFIDRWAVSGGSEQANYQLFLAELCDLLDVPRPEPATPDNQENGYVFERSLRFTDGEGSQTTNYIDLYKRDCFVCETKQGVEQSGGQDLLSSVGETSAKYLKTGHGKRDTLAWNRMMKKARGQGERYIRSLPTNEGRPPFLLAVDVGHVIEVYAEFTRTGGNYTPYPDVRGYRIRLDDLRHERTRSRLRAIWTDPLSLDPARISAAITRELAEKLGRLARSLERDGHAAEQVASFLMRCLFTMFSEDVGLLPHRSFTELLESHRDDLEFLPPSLEALWQTMDTGGASIQLKKKLPRFNGGLFAERDALPLNRDQLELLIESGHADWTNVEPAIFGTLLERALDPAERHKLGAHYTPREYVERLVLPTIVQPLREDWASVEAAASQLDEADNTTEAVATIEGFLRRLTQIRVLDPACGSGNFLYVTLEHLKRLEGEVLEALAGLGATQATFEMAGVTVDPHQLLGLEINPRAVAIADIVLWIGYLQWHFRTHGNAPPPEPVLRNFHNIKHQDALIGWDDVEDLLDENGQPITHWDGQTTKTSPITGKEIPDESARLTEKTYINPRRVVWPDADFIVGNPPYLGARVIRAAVGSGYLDAVRSVYGDVPQNADYVMYWWQRAAELVRNHDARRFGLITTNSIRQSFCRAVVETHLKDEKNFSLVFCAPDHPWIDAHLGAAVRVALTVGAGCNKPGRLLEIEQETYDDEGVAKIDFAKNTGMISPALTINYDPAGSPPLLANADMSCVGYQLSGRGFLLTREQVEQQFAQVHDSVIRPLLSGRDITQRTRDLFAIDVCRLTEPELREAEPTVYQWLLNRVKPERDENKRASVAKNWWIYGEARNSFRPALSGLNAVIVTSLTARHRLFTMAPPETIADSTTVMFALDDPFYFGVMSSRFHQIWARAAGGTLEDRPRYNKSICFDNFPFPNTDPAYKKSIREIAEKLESHRKAQQAAHPRLTLTGIYNVLEKLRAGDTLTAKDKTVHEQGLVSVLAELHDELDAAVAEAYGWPADLTDAQILERLLALNLERAEEERAGHIRWLRPEYQNPDGQDPSAQAKIAVAVQAGAQKLAKQKLPVDLPSRFTVIRSALAAMPDGGDAEAVAARFKGARRNAVNDILETLAGLGQIQRDTNGRYRL